ncbi:ABC transporter permease [Tepidanaerobacter syntrophicus]|uniref:Peptide/nickel transport system permease protein n=1 Tax=Tepidanaerobacter syntrophicus TaxID=224999 RepID=A0A0U9I536_9FIRM|nr:ABC transporter permease [Tepidanaerobacter syntrophicus]GAQ25576.1 peptide/nickel transport system permease protein [Tepidanaerobacter syntrophicus]GLI20300.1 peptide ABC transporter permease [Tepidanaerobacter syntrophicus]
MSNNTQQGIDEKNSKSEVKKNAFQRFLQHFSGNSLALVAFILLILIIAISIFAPFIAPYNPAKGNIVNRLKPPTFERPADGSFPHILGTDQQGRDVLSRLIYGGRVSMSVGFTVVAIGGTIGTLLGLIAGYFGGWTDLIIMRIVDVASSFPGLLIALTFVMVLGPGQANLTIALLLVGWMIYARMARSQVLTARESTMVEASRAIGCSMPRILFNHILPNVISPLITTFVLEMAHMISAEANMSFLGYGIQPPASSWGLMIGEGRQYITSAWWIVVFPGLIIALTVLCLNLVGNWVREEFDPLQKGRH